MGKKYPATKPGKVTIRNLNVFFTQMLDVLVCRNFDDWVATAGACATNAELRVGQGADVL